MPVAVEASRSVARQLVRLLRERGDVVERLLRLDPLEAAGELGVPPSVYMVALASLASDGYIVVLESTPTLEALEALGEAMGLLDADLLAGRLRPERYQRLLAALWRLASAPGEPVGLGDEPPPLEAREGLALLLYRRLRAAVETLSREACAKVEAAREMLGELDELAREALALELSRLASRLAAVASSRLASALLDAPPGSPAWSGLRERLPRLVARLEAEAGRLAAREAEAAGEALLAAEGLASALAAAGESLEKALDAAAGVCGGAGAGERGEGG